MEPWVAAAIADGSCLALTDTGLADLLERDDVDAIRKVWQARRLGGGVVMVERT